MQSRRQVRALLVGCALAAGVVRPASAEPPADVRGSARDLADQGANAYAEGDYDRALLLFRHAHQLVPAPTIALFEARTLEQLGRLREARDAYVRLIGAEQRADAPAQFRAAVEAARAELELLEPRIPRLHVVAAGAMGKDSVVLLDGLPLASPLLHAPLLVDPGTHSLRFQNSRGSGAPVQIALAEGETKHVRLDIPPTPDQDPRRTWGFIGLGVGGAGLVLGVAAGFVALNAHDDAERGCPENRCVAGTPGAGEVERFRDWRTVSTVGYVVGAVGVGTGIALLLTSERDQGRQLALVPTLGGARLETTW